MIATIVKTLACASDIKKLLCVTIKHRNNTNQTKGRLISVPVNVSTIASFKAFLSRLIMAKTCHLFIEQILLLVSWLFTDI